MQVFADPVCIHNMTLCTASELALLKLHHRRALKIAKSNLIKILGECTGAVRNCTDRVAISDRWVDCTPGEMKPDLRTYADQITSIFSTTGILVMTVGNYVSGNNSYLTLTLYIPVNTGDTDAVILNANYDGTWCGGDRPTAVYRVRIQG